MNKMILIAPMVIFFVLASHMWAQGPARPDDVWKALRCKPISSRPLSLSLKSVDGASALTIKRSSKSVEVWAKVSPDAYEQDHYTISSDNIEGLAATFSFGRFPTVKTIIVRGDGRSALWITASIASSKGAFAGVSEVFSCLREK